MHFLLSDFPLQINGMGQLPLPSLIITILTSTMHPLAMAQLALTSVTTLRALVPDILIHIMITMPLFLETIQLHQTNESN